MSEDSQNNTLNSCFDKTLKVYRIKASYLAVVSGAPASQISQFRSGQRNLSTAQLEKVLAAMETISPGSRAYFHLLAAGPFSGRQLVILLNAVADSLQEGVSSKHPLEVAVL